MTLEQQKQIEREFQDAKTPEEVTKAQTHAILALVDCQRKTGERVKKLSWKVFAVVFGGGGGVGAMLTHIEQIRSFFGM
jgi:hypothetical protein